MFLKHAKLHNKLKDSDTMVALFNEQCKMLIGNPYMQGPSIQRPLALTPPPNVIQNSLQESTARKGQGGLPVNGYSFGEMRSLTQKQFEQEQVIKRLQMAMASMRELLHD